MLTMLRTAVIALPLLLGVAQAEQPAPPPQNQTSSNPPIPMAPPMRADQLPTELAGWSPWLLAGHPNHGCTLVAGTTRCAWPGRLALSVAADGAKGTLDVVADRDTTLALPGGAGTWPSGVTVDGRPTPVLSVGGVPTVGLGPGAHQIAWSVPWSSTPAALPVPTAIGLVDLTVLGERVNHPSRDADGTLRLARGETAGTESDVLTLEVGRKIADGVPLEITTVLQLSVAGSAREATLGPVVLQDSLPVELTADLPAHLDEEGRLVAQVRPGRFTVTVHATMPVAVAQLQPPKAPAPWPTEEAWAVQTNELTRALQLSGPAPIDPGRTTMPKEWHNLPAFLVRADTPLSLTEIRRGDPQPAPNQLSLERHMWLDNDGGGFTVRDTFSGKMTRDWRLDVAPPAELGRVVDGATPLVLTTREGQVGAEVRTKEVQVVAELRIPERAATLPAVGWNTDVSSLSARLHLPPGWRLAAALGVDEVNGPIRSWNLFDLFFVLLVSLATGRLIGWRWSFVAAGGLGLARHVAGAPTWLWVALIVAIALGRVLPKGIAATATWVARWLITIGLFVSLVPFSVLQVEQGLFPVLERADKTPFTPAHIDDLGIADIPDRFTKLIVTESVSNQVTRGGGWGYGSKKISGEYLAQQVDPTAVVNTGPGIPNWQWDVYELGWSGPVPADHQMRLIVVGPFWVLVAALLRVVLLLALAVGLSGLHRSRPTRPSQTAVALFLLALFAPSTQALATPSASVLAEAEARLIAPAPCSPDCTANPHTALSLGPDLRLVAEVHAAAPASWALPGPTSSWVPDEVLVDGRPALALARQSDGFLHVRLDPGVHTVEAVGPLPASGSLPLQFGAELPQRVTWTGQGWSTLGVRSNGRIERSIQIVRTQQTGAVEAATPTASSNLAPWLMVRRELDLGMPWAVRTTVQRRGPSTHPLPLEIPLLPGEEVNDPSLSLQGEAVSIILARDQQELSWTSALPVTETLVLTAPLGVPWTEQWDVNCSPIFACSTEGIPPEVHTPGGTWAPRFRAWPGESLTISAQRPPAAEGGQTVTVDDVHLVWIPGRRIAEAKLTMTIRSSGAANQVLTLPPGAELLGVTLEGQDRPIQARADNTVHLPIQPGSTSVAVRWQQPHNPHFVDRVAPVDLGSEAVNVTVQVNAAEGRWIVALMGPRWGPVPRMWTYILVVLLIAPLLGRVKHTPLAWWQWALLGLGMCQVPVPLTAAVVLTLLGLAWRQDNPPARAWVHNLLQLGLGAMVVVSMVSLYFAVHAGLLFEPNVQVAGNGSSNTVLMWFTDRTAGLLPQPTVVSLPMWTWRVAMLVWSLWLAASLVRWAPWVWECLRSGGFFRELPKPKREPVTDASPSSDPGSAGH